MTALASGSRVKEVKEQFCYHWHMAYRKGNDQRILKLSYCQVAGPAEKNPFKFNPIEFLEYEAQLFTSVH